VPVGIIEALGAGVTSRTVGERVAIAWLGYACGECEFRLDGWETLCDKQQNSGDSVDGAFAEYSAVAAGFATPVPVGVSARDVAP
jgi:alcohol dehydrogenase, propanol-preferring